MEEGKADQRKSDPHLDDNRQVIAGDRSHGQLRARDCDPGRLLILQDSDLVIVGGVGEGILFCPGLGLYIYMYTVCAPDEFSSTTLC